MSYRLGLKSNNKSVCYFCNNQATTTSIGIIYRGSCYWRLTDRMSVYYFSPLIVYITLIHASWWEGSAPINSSLISPCFICQLWGIFSSRVSPSSSRGEPRAPEITMFHESVGHHWQELKSKQNVPAMGLCCLGDSLCFLLWSNFI